MIIEFTFRDNDFTQVIEKFLDDHELFNENNFKSSNDYLYFKDSISSYDQLPIVFPKRESKKIELKKTIKDVFIKYLNNINDKTVWLTEDMTTQDLIESRKYLLDNLMVNVIDVVPDQCKNGEYVYYFTSNIKYITL